MTTIILNKSKDFSKTYFDTPQELFTFLRDQLSPVPVFLLDDEEIPELILDSINKAEAEGDDGIIDFRIKG